MAPPPPPAPPSLSVMQASGANFNTLSSYLGPSNGQSNPDFARIFDTDQSGNRIAAWSYHDENFGVAKHVQVFEYNASSSTLQIVGSNTPFLQWSTVTTISLSGDGTTFAISYYDGGGDRKGATYVHTLNADKIWIQKGNALTGAHRHDQCGISIDLSNDGNTLAIGCFQKEKSSEYPGYAAIYKWRLGSWHQLGENIAKDGYRWFGHKVCLNEDGSIVAIGTEVYNGNNGVVEVYMWNTGELRWQQLGDKLTPEGAGWGSRFGNYVKLNSDGTILTVGCSWCVDKGSRVGAILFYKYDGSNWVHTNSFYGNRASTSAKLSGVSVNNDANVIAYNYHGDFFTKYFDPSEESWKTYGKDPSDGQNRWRSCTSVTGIFNAAGNRLASQCRYSLSKPLTLSEYSLP